MKLNELMNEFLADVKIYKKEGTFKYYKCHCDTLLLYFDRYEDITEASLKKFIIYGKEKKLSNNTINKRINILKMICEYHNLDISIFSKIKKLKTVKKHIGNLSVIELKKLDNYLDSNVLKLQNKLIVQLFLQTGIRRNELLNIEIKNINLNDNTILLETTKTDINRYVYFNDKIKDDLKKYMDSRCGEKYLFKISESGIMSIFERIKNKLKFNQFTPHTLRHNFATILASNNVNMAFVQELMGHLNLSTTQRYMHLTNDLKKEIYFKCFNI